MPLPQVCVCVSDYGLTAEVINYYATTNDLPRRWMPPEALMQSRFSEKSDVWAFGVLLYEMWSYCMIPYFHITDDSRLTTLVCAGERLPKPDGCPDTVYDVMKRCWEASPQGRPTFTELRRLLAAAAPPGPQIVLQAAPIACAICYDDCEDGDSHVMVPCGHGTYHEACAVRCMALQQTCPQCRRVVTSRQRVFLGA
jgi:serine/threonine protein kinase